MNKHTLNITQGLWDIILELQGLEIRPGCDADDAHYGEVTVMLLLLMVMMLMEDDASDDWMSEIWGC